MKLTTRIIIVRKKRTKLQHLKHVKFQKMIENLPEMEINK